MIVTFAHHKGGTGKTTTCTSVAGELAKRGRRVLVVDMDPQANATAGLGVDVSTVKATAGRATSTAWSRAAGWRALSPTR